MLFYLNMSHKPSNLILLNEQVSPTLPSQVNAGWETDADVGPMISPEAKARCEQLIKGGIASGAQVCSCASTPSSS